MRPTPSRHARCSASHSGHQSWRPNESSPTCAAAPPVPRIAAYFAALYALCATQDVAVDGWALTLLSKRRAGWAATCNGVGQSLGYALSYVGFVALHARGRVSLAAFVEAPTGRG